MIIVVVHREGLRSLLHHHPELRRPHPNHVSLRRPPAAPAILDTAGSLHPPLLPRCLHRNVIRHRWIATLPNRQETSRILSMNLSLGMQGLKSKSIKMTTKESYYVGSQKRWFHAHED